MNSNALRVAFCPDSYHEINGVANTARWFETFARDRQLPMLLFAGAAENHRIQNGSITRIELARGPLSFPLDKDLRFDLAFLRHLQVMLDALRQFKPDLVHITGPSDVGIAGLTAAHELGIPLVASWHTNVHEYAGRRSMSLVPEALEQAASANVQDAVFAMTARFYRAAQLLFAPNLELVAQLSAATSKPCCLMSRGVDATAFSPANRDREQDGCIEIGYVGRLTAEKSVRDLAAVGRALLEAGLDNFRILFVGQGSESEWLQANVPHAVMAGVRHGAELARCYANFDIFAFPSRTDTFGNVVLEAMASGVPVVTAGMGGPKYLVEHGVTGFHAAAVSDFSASVLKLATNAGLRVTLGTAARHAALRASWPSVFESVYDAYALHLNLGRLQRADVLPASASHQASFAAQEKE